MSAQPLLHLSPSEYLAFERDSQERHEYYFGEIFNMSGASRNHNRIAQNLSAEFYLKLKKRPCNPYQSDLRVRIPSKSIYTYPDVLVVCGKEEFEDNAFDTLLNPTLIVEVLSASTENYDRSKKFEYYQQIPSLKEYILISQEKYLVEQFIKQADKKWIYQIYNDLVESILFPSLAIEIPLADIYYDIVLDENPT